MKLDLQGTDISTAVSEAIIVQLGDEGRRELIAGAIQALVSKQTRDRGYGQKEEAPSVLEDAFAHAVQVIARETVTKLVTEDKEARAQVEGLVREVFTKMLSVDQGDLAQAMATALSAAFEKVAWR